MRETIEAGYAGGAGLWGGRLAAARGDEAGLKERFRQIAARAKGAIPDGSPDEREGRRI